MATGHSRVGRRVREFRVPVPIRVRSCPLGRLTWVPCVVMEPLAPLPGLWWWVIPGSKYPPGLRANPFWLLKFPKAEFLNVRGEFLGLESELMNSFAELTDSHGEFKFRSTEFMNLNREFQDLNREFGTSLGLFRKPEPNFEPPRRFAVPCAAPAKGAVSAETAAETSGIDRCRRGARRARSAEVGASLRWRAAFDTGAGTA